MRGSFLRLSTRSTDLAQSRCHGPAIFADLKDESGIPIVKGKRITGFTTQAEIDMGVMDGLRAWGEPLTDEHAKALGAECKPVPRCKGELSEGMSR